MAESDFDIFPDHESAFDQFPDAPGVATASPSPQGRLAAFSAGAGVNPDVAAGSNAYDAPSVPAANAYDVAGNPAAPRQARANAENAVLDQRDVLRAQLADPANKRPTQDYLDKSYGSLSLPQRALENVVGGLKGATSAGMAPTIGLLAPNIAAELNARNEQQMPQADNWQSTAARAAGGIAPMLLAGPAQAVAVGGLSAAGGTREEVATMRDQDPGREITPGQEWEAAAKQGAIGALMGYGQGKLIAGRFTKGIANAAMRGAATVGTDVAANTAIGVGQNIAGNVVAQQTYDPTRETTANTAKSAIGGAAGGLAMAPFSVMHANQARREMGRPGAESVADRPNPPPRAGEVRAVEPARIPAGMQVTYEGRTYVAGDVAPDVFQEAIRNHPVEVPTTAGTAGPAEGAQSAGPTSPQGEPRQTPPVEARRFDPSSPDTLPQEARGSPPPAPEAPRSQQQEPPRGDAVGGDVAPAAVRPAPADQGGAAADAGDVAGGAGGARQPWEMTRKEFIQDKDTTVINNETEGPKPNKYREGDLVIDSYGENPYVYRLQYIDPKTIEFGLEGATREHVINKASTQKYIEWAKQGMEPAPITVVLKDGTGRPFSTNRRRVIAAQEAGSAAIPAFVEIGRHKDMIEAAVRDGRPVPPEVLADYPGLAPTPSGRSGMTPQRPPTGAPEKATQSATGIGPTSRVEAARAELDAFRAAKAARVAEAHRQGKRPGAAQGPLDPQELILYGKLAVAHFLDGATRFKDWSARMLADVPELVGDAHEKTMKRLFRQARKEEEGPRDERVNGYVDGAMPDDEALHRGVRQTAGLEMGWANVPGFMKELGEPLSGRPAGEPPSPERFARDAGRLERKVRRELEANAREAGRTARTTAREEGEGPDVQAQARQGAQDAYAARADAFMRQDFPSLVKELRAKMGVATSENSPMGDALPSVTGKTPVPPGSGGGDTSPPVAPPTEPPAKPASPTEASATPKPDKPPAPKEKPVTGRERKPLEDQLRHVIATSPEHHDDLMHQRSATNPGESNRQRGFQKSVTVGVRVAQGSLEPKALVSLDRAKDLARALPADHPARVILNKLEALEADDRGGGPTSIKNAQTDVERARRGMPEVDKVARRDLGGVWDSAGRDLDENPNLARDLVDSLRANPRALTDHEDALLLRRQVELQNEYQGLAERIIKEGEAESEAMPELRARLEDVSNQLLDVYNVGKASGTETGRGLNARKLMANADYTLAAMEVKERQARGGAALTAEQRAEVTALHRKIADAESAHKAALAGKDRALAEVQSKLVHAEMVREEKNKSLSRAPKMPRAKLGALDRVIAAGDAAFERLRKAFGGGSTLRDVTDVAKAIPDLAIWGAGELAKLTKATGKRAADLFDAVKAKAVALVGDDVLPHFDEIWKRAAKIHGDAANEKRAKTLDGIKDAAKDGAEPPDVGRLFDRLARDHIADGIHEREPLIDAVHADVKDMMPDGWTREQTRDAICGYGDFRQLSKDEVSVKLREFKGEMQQLGKLDDMAKGQAPKKTGVERREPSDAERRLIKDVNEQRRKLGIAATDPETQLAGVMDGIKTRLKHEIADLDFQLANGQRADDARTPVQYDAEATGLKAQRDAKRDELDRLFPKDTSAADAEAQRQRHASEENALQKKIDENTKRLAEDDLSTTGGRQGPDRPAVAALKARAAELSAELARRRKEVARDAPTGKDPADVRLQERLRKELEEVNQKIANNDLSRPGTRQGPDSAETARLKAETAAARERLSEIREGTPEAQLAAATKAAESNLRQAEGRLADARNGTFRRPEDGRPRVAGPELDALRARVDAANAEVAALRAIDPDVREARQVKDLETRIRRLQDVQTKDKAVRPPDTAAVAELRAELERLRAARPGKAKLTPEEIAVNVARAAKARQIADYADRLARGDFGPRKAKQPSRDDGVLRLAAIGDEMKARWQKRVRQLEFANRPLAQKATAAFMDVLGTLPKAVTMSLDLSMMGIQGAVYVAGHPVRAAMLLPRVKDAMLSPIRKRVIEGAINDRPNARNGNYRKYVEFTGMDDVTSHREEGFASHIISSLAEVDPKNPIVKALSLPLRAGAKGIAGAERGYSTLLNLVRADTFDAMAGGLSKGKAPTPAELEAIGNFVNVSSGRGKVGQTVQKAMGLLNLVFLAPRHVVSRFQMVTGQPLYRGTMRTRAAVAVEYARFGLGLAAFYAMAKWAGADVETDVRAGDGWKVRFGDTTIDPTAGFGSMARFGWRTLTGKTKLKDGTLAPLRGPGTKYGHGWDVSAKDYLRTKLSPAAGAAWDFFKGETPDHAPATPGELLKGLTVPLSGRDVYDALTRKGVHPGAAYGILSLLGMNVRIEDGEGERIERKAKRKAENREYRSGEIERKRAAADKVNAG